MKKLISMSIALAMLLSLAACGSDEGGSTAEADVTTTAAIKAVKDETTTEETTVPEETNTEETTTTEPPLEVVEPAAEDFEYNYDAAIKGVIITQYTGKDKAIRIPTELDGDPVVQFVLNNNVITHVEIPDGFTSIGYRAFSKCPNLKSVTIPDSVTEICEEAFNKCPKLESITISNNVTRIWGNAFNECTSLKSVVIPDSVKEFGYWAYESNSGCGSSVFTGCENLETVTLPERMEQEWFGGFIGCKNLKEITIPDGVKKISGLRGCESLESITIPDGVEIIGDYAFSYCKGLKEVTIPASVKLIDGHAFEYCEGLTVTYKGSEYNYTNFSDMEKLIPYDLSYET